MRKTMLVVAVATVALFAQQSLATATTSTTWYLHGVQPVGEAEIPDSVLSSLYMPMDATAPTAGQPKSMQIINYLAGPNTHCSGNGLFPVWSGQVTGQIVGNLTLKLDVAALTANTGGPTGPYLSIRVFPDASSGCNDAYVEPAAKATVHLDAGLQTATVTIPNPNGFAVQESLAVMISSVDGGPGTWTAPYGARVLYDSTDHASSLSFTLA